MERMELKIETQESLFYKQWCRFQREARIEPWGILVFKGKTEKGTSLKETKKDQVENQTTRECGVANMNGRVS